MPTFRPKMANSSLSVSKKERWQSRLRRGEFLDVFEQEGPGLVMAQDPRGVYHIGKAEVVRDLAPVLSRPSAQMPSGRNLVVVPLQFVGAAEMADILKPIVPNDAFVRVDGLRNLLILAGSRSQVDGYLDIVKTFDVDVLNGMSIGLFPQKIWWRRRNRQPDLCSRL